MFLSARSWSQEDTADAKPFGDNSNIYHVPGFQSMDREGAVHFTGGRSVPCVDTVRVWGRAVARQMPLKVTELQQ